MAYDNGNKLLNQQLFDMLRDRFDVIDASIKDVKSLIEVHTEKDEHYWKMIDDQQAQLRMVKWLSTGLSGSALTAWLWNKLGH